MQNPRQFMLTHWPVEPQYNERGLLDHEDIVVGAIKTATAYESGTRMEVNRRLHKLSPVIKVSFRSDTASFQRFL
jgi:hypothetical protein